MPDSTACATVIRGVRLGVSEAAKNNVPSTSPVLLGAPAANAGAG